MPDFKDVVAERLRYEPETGKFFWRKEVASRQMRPDLLAGGIGLHGYWYVMVDGRLIRAHRLAWLVVTGEWPPKGYEIDHINGDRADNRWPNLRLATRAQNNVNSRLRAANQSGQAGVTLRKDTGKWHARITVNKRVILLGNFDSREAAIAVRREAEDLYYGAYSPRASRPEMTKNS